jgi:alcohol dehydrogenase class IV
VDQHLMTSPGEAGGVSTGSTGRQVSSTRGFSLAPHGRIEFGPGAVGRLGAVVSGVGRSRAFVVTDRGMPATGIVDRVETLLRDAGLTCAVFAGVEPNPSTETLDAAAEHARSFGDAVVVAVGGGSALDAAKGIALLAANRGSARSLGHVIPQHPGLPLVAVPTTAGTGAETNGFGVIEDRRAGCKVYIGDASVQPLVSVLDPELTLGLPSAVTASTGMDALTHGIESLASVRGNAVSAAYATEAVTLVSGHLARAVADGTDLEARSALLVGAHLAGLALSISGLGLVHGLAHSITSHTGAVHGLALTAVLDEVMTRSLGVAGPAYRRVAGAMGLDATDPAAPLAAVAAVRALAEAVGARHSLAELGVRAEQVPSVVAGALADAVSVNHPRRFEPAEVEEIVTRTLQQR